MKETILSTNKLSKHFGRVKAVQELNLNIESGQVFGLLGPNGSGKTTTLGMVLGVLNPTKGSFLWYGQPGNHTVRQKIGAILEHPIFFPHLSATNNLKIAAHIKNVQPKRIAEVLQWVGLAERKNDPFKTFSLGMKQRLAIASALLSDPKVLILDEPTNGLDPLGIADIRGLITRIADEGKTIILASHLLDEVQKVCSNFAVLHRGKLIYTGNVKDDLNNAAYFDVAADDLAQLKHAIETFEPAKNVKQEDGVITFQTSVSGSDINRYLLDRNIVASQITPRKNTLESQFLNLVAQHEETA